jgi:hypothetical protein
LTFVLEGLFQSSYSTLSTVSRQQNFSRSNRLQLRGSSRKRSSAVNLPKFSTRLLSILPISACVYSLFTCVELSPSLFLFPLFCFSSYPRRGWPLRSTASYLRHVISLLESYCLKNGRGHIVSSDGSYKVGTAHESRLVFVWDFPVPPLSIGASWVAFGSSSNQLHGQGLVDYQNGRGSRGERGLL